MMPEDAVKGVSGKMEGVPGVSTVSGVSTDDHGTSSASYVGRGAIQGAPRDGERQAIDSLTGTRLWAWRAVAFVVLSSAWQLASGSLVPAHHISDPLRVGARLWSWVAGGTLWINLSPTVTAMALGLLFGFLAGVVSGIAMGWFSRVAAVLDPFVSAFYAVPKLAIAPLFILWFGIGLQMKVVLVTVIVYFFVFSNVYSGFRAIDQELLDAVKVMGADRRRVIKVVVLPSSAEWMYAALKIAVPYSLVGAVVGEMLASNRGMGYVLLRAAGNFDSTGLLAGIIVLVVVSTVLSLSVNLSKRWVLRWREEPSV